MNNNFRTGKNFKFLFITAYCNNNFFWIRFFGKGFRVKSIKIYGLTFSEANKFKKYYTILGYAFTFLN